jgi:hypothetical protein
VHDGDLAGVGPTTRQQVLVLYLATSALDSPVVGWAWYDGTGQESSETGDHPEPPYESGLAALRDGWRLFWCSPLGGPLPGREYTTSYQKFEFFFERFAEIRPGPDDGDQPSTSSARSTFGGGNG